ncbi:hypothetical protein ABZ319_31770 [Nocardia sp. NPDC005978]|uniref:hypothetical protein n=1 Tax=Nocardia sp. NPDC005978 TaxID=3156725 RepID=UPI0033A65E68
MSALWAVVVARADGWSGAGFGLSIKLTQSALIATFGGDEPLEQLIFEWWQP